MNEGKSQFSQRLLNDVYEAGKAWGHNVGFEDGLRAAQEAMRHAPKNPFAMELQHGDTIVRKMGNGYAIVTVSGDGVVSTTQVVEGDMNEVGKLLIANEATKQIAPAEQQMGQGIAMATQAGYAPSNSGLLGVAASLAASGQVRVTSNPNSWPPAPSLMNPMGKNW